MRVLVMVLSTVSPIILFGTLAEAQNYPWCAQYAKGDDAGLNCGFISFEQCLATVRGVGGFCIQNNTYEAPPASYASPKRHRLKQHP